LIQRARNSAKRWVAGDRALARRYIAAGVRFVAVGVEATLLARATRELAGRFRTSPERPPGPGSQGY